MNQMQFQFITHHTDNYSYYDSAYLALEGGCRWIQLRMKESHPDEIEQEAYRIQALCKRYNAVLILNDHVLLAKKIQADGVHLGKTDMPVAEARELLGKDFIIGGTANSFGDLKLHYESGADYIGLGPFRYTSTKKNLSSLLGLKGYQDITLCMRAGNIRIPVVAIGGINKEDIPDILDSGLTGIALSGSILKADNPIEETKQIVATINRYKK